MTAVGMLVLRFHWLTDLVGGAALAVLLLQVLRLVDRTLLAHLPGADRGIAGRRRVGPAGVRAGGARVGG